MLLGDWKKVVDPSWQLGEREREDLPHFSAGLAKELFTGLVPKGKGHQFLGNNLRCRGIPHQLLVANSKSEVSLWFFPNAALPSSLGEFPEASLGMLCSGFLEEPSHSAASQEGCDGWRLQD